MRGNYIVDKKILIIDDEHDLAKMMAICLKSHGFQTEIACDGQTGLLKVKSFQPDLILLDIVMPQMDGKIFCQYLHADADPKVREIPIIIMTALLSLGQKKVEMMKGDYSVLIKPFKEEILIRTIHSKLGTVSH